MPVWLSSEINRINIDNILKVVLSIVAGVEGSLEVIQGDLLFWIMWVHLINITTQLKNSFLLWFGRVGCCPICFVVVMYYPSVFDLWWPFELVTKECCDQRPCSVFADLRPITSFIQSISVLLGSTVNYVILCYYIVTARYGAWGDMFKVFSCICAKRSYLFLDARHIGFRCRVLYATLPQGAICFEFAISNVTL